MTRSLTMMLALFCAALTISSACTAEPASAEVVRYQDLDLSRPGQVRILQQRIERAANAMCLHASGPSPAATVDATCKLEAVRAAREQVAAPQSAGRAAAAEFPSPGRS